MPGGPAAHEGHNSSSSTKPSICSQLDELAGVLASCRTPLPAAAAVCSVDQAFAGSSSGEQAPPVLLEWSALPRAVDAESSALGVSTRKLTARRQAKQERVDAAKLAARVARKRAQVESFLLVLRPLLAAAGHHQQQQDHGQPDHQHHHQQQQVHVVDFCCGTGNLLAPLAALFPHVRFTGVDMKPAALALLRSRAAAAGLANVATWQGMVEVFDQPFDVALALHACGNATDHVLQLAVAQRAAFIVSPCCVGKLRFSLTGGSSFHAQPVAWTPTQPGDRPVQQQHKQHQHQHQHPQPSQAGYAEQREAAGPAAGQQAPQLRHPRSDWLLAQLQPEPQRRFKAMAKVADLSHAPAERAELVAALQQRAAVADACKRLLELDRCAAAAEAGGYAVGLFKVLQAASMAKNDLLVGVPQSAAHQAGAASPGDVVDGSGAQHVQQQQPVGSQQHGGWLSRAGDALAHSGVLMTAAAFGGCAAAVGQQQQPHQADGASGQPAGNGVR